MRNSTDRLFLIAALVAVVALWWQDHNDLVSAKANAPKPFERVASNAGVASRAVADKVTTPAPVPKRGKVRANTKITIRPEPAQTGCQCKDVVIDVARITEHDGGDRASVVVDGGTLISADDVTIPIVPRKVWGAGLQYDLNDRKSSAVIQRDIGKVVSVQVTAGDGLAVGVLYRF